MSQTPSVKGIGRASLAVCTLVVALSPALPVLAHESATGGITVASQSPEESNFDEFVRQVGIDMATVPTEIRGQWASGPRAGLDDCGGPVTHAGHPHGDGYSEPKLSRAGQHVE